MNDTKPAALTVAVVGDVHGLWENADAEALEALGVDLVLFVGDFGNESLETVRAIAQLSLPKAVILGNHDCWYTASPWGKKKCPYDPQIEDRVSEQLQILGETHVGYSKLDFPQFQLSVVGGRPFSWGGSDWKNPGFYRDRYGINNFAESTRAIVNSIKQTLYSVVIAIAHCGPYGLGDRPEDICGKDWNPIGGDYGEPDLADAIAQSRHLGKQIPLVAFGHMHHRLRHTQARLRATTARDTYGTFYLNAARVPRIIVGDRGKLRNFSLVTLENGSVSEAKLIWVNERHQIETEEILYTIRPSIAEIGYTRNP
ncbi:TIGR04168 family protein [Roseofilum casamattae]|uniref:TIGR04168 family protein n=1 Tax=Roseofilum casamattae BLCC-M143 TaxID=3022442 RepID=A0ABT7BVP1_9CYAN|nr:TIGR04168 family protein [Roseofilum casamattae BLCC-M143]